VAVTLPAGVDGQIFVIVDGKGDAATNNITITPNGSDTIYGGATLALTQNRQSAIIQYSSGTTNWNIVGGFFANLPNTLTNPMTTAGDIILAGASGTPGRLAKGAAGTVLKGGATPAYGQVANADVDPSAAIAYSKLNLGTSIVNADVSASAAIAYSKLNLGTSIVNADVSASAAIAGSKIAAATSSVTGTVSYEDSGTFALTWQQNAGAHSSVTVRYRRVGSIVTMMVPDAVAASLGSGAFVSSVVGVVPSALRPTTFSHCWPVTITNNSAIQASPGLLEVSTSGNFALYLSLAKAPFSATGTCGLSHALSFTWEV
jgi:hypothetical protein